MWVINMVLCCVICFGGFGYAIYLMDKANKRKAAVK